MHHKTTTWMAMGLLAMSSIAHAQNPAVDQLSQFANSATTLNNARAIGTLCFAGNRLSARLQSDCNTLVGAAFGADPAVDTAVRSALARITADNATIPLDRSGLGKASLVPVAPSGSGPGWAALMTADPSVVAMSLSGDGEGADWSLFVNARFDQNDRDRSTNEDGFSSDGNAATVGVDLRTSPNSHVGAAISFGRNNLDYTDASGKLDTRETGFNLFAGWQADNGFYLDSLLTFNRRKQDQVRRIAYGLGSSSVDQSFDSKFDSDERLLALTAGFQVNRGAASFNPYLRVELVKADSDGYTEISRNPTGNGGGWALQVAPIDESFNRTALGMRAAYAISGSNGVYLPFVDLSLIKVNGANNEPASVRYTGDLSANVNLSAVDFLMVADAEDNSYGSAALGMSAQWANGWSGFFSYRRNFAESRYTQEQINLGLRMEF